MHALDYAYDGLRPTLRCSPPTSTAPTPACSSRAGPRTTPSASGRRRRRHPRLPRPRLLPRGLAGYRYASSPRSRRPRPSRPPRRGAGAGEPRGRFRLAWGFSSARRQTFSVSPGGGRTLLLALEHAQEGLGSDRTFTRASADWAEYLSLPWSRHVLQARLFAGGAGGDTPAQGAFSLGGDAPGDIAFSVDAAPAPARLPAQRRARRPGAARRAGVPLPAPRDRRAAATRRPALRAPAPRRALRRRRQRLGRRRRPRRPPAHRASAPSCASTSSSRTSRR